MSRDRKLVVALLGVVAVLLALNLVKGEPEAMGQSPPGLADAPVVPLAMSVVNDPSHSRRVRVFRMWSDGSVDSTYHRYATDAGPTTCNLTGTFCTVQLPID